MDAISWLQTRRLETRSSFSDRVRRELSNGGSVAQFPSGNEKIDTFAIIGDVWILSWFSREGKLHKVSLAGLSESGRVQVSLEFQLGSPREPANLRMAGFWMQQVNVCCEMLQILRNYCARSNRSNATILVSPILSPNGSPSNLTTLPPSDGREFFVKTIRWSSTR